MSDEPTPPQPLTKEEVAALKQDAINGDLDEMLALCLTIDKLERERDEAVKYRKRAISGLVEEGGKVEQLERERDRLKADVEGLMKSTLTNLDMAAAASRVREMHLRRQLTAERERGEKAVAARIETLQTLNRVLGKAHGAFCECRLCQQTVNQIETLTPPTTGEEVL